MAQLPTVADHATMTKPRTTCRHCGTTLSRDPGDGFCCRGCAAVHRLLHDAGLERYYALGGGEGHPVVALGASVDRKWLEPTLARVAATSGLTRVLLDVQGVHCAACVWLIERLFHRRLSTKATGEIGRVLVNPGLGTVELTIAPSFPLARWIEDVEAFGYRFGPPLKFDEDASKKALQGAAQSDLVWRMGVCIAIAMNTMIFGIAIYCGLSDGPVYRLFHALDFALAFVSVLIGGTVFFRSALRALARGIVHLDLPIAIGIALAFTSSAWTYLGRGGATSYFDTLNVFIALMLVGRFLQERVLARNRAMLLASDGAEGLYTRRITSGRVELVRCPQVVSDDLLLLAHGDIVPVEATLLQDESPALFSLDWISGESAPRSFEPGEIIPAGAFSCGARAVRVQARTAFEASNLVALLRTTTRRDGDVARSTQWYARLTRIYVASVLIVAAAAFAGWFVVTRDLARTLDVVAAVLIVTCPCAFGIATPLAYELAQGALRRIGLFVRTPGFLDRAAEVTRVVFDKTGTLTTGRLVVENPDVLEALSPLDRARLFALAVRSSHPKSRAIEEALRRWPEASSELTNADVRETVGRGLELRTDVGTYRLGAPGWAIAPAKVPAIDRAAASADVVFARDGEVLAAVMMTEELRDDAASEVAELQREGYEVYVLSGDAEVKAAAMARACGIPDSHAYGGRSPEGKAAWLRARGPAKTLFVGDGINDSLVAEEASCAGTPAIDRPFMASRCDFYFVTPGLRPIRAALETARTLERVVRRNLVIALAYNAVTVSLALSGLMSPLLCAVLMPVSSLSTVLATMAQISLRRAQPAPRSSRKDPKWKS